jgi:hypothetical protein
MITYAKLVQHPNAFRTLTGVSRPEFDRLFRRFQPLWLEAEATRLGRAERQRAIGGGRKYNLALRSQLLMTLIWLRLYLDTATLGVLLNVHKSTVSRNSRRVLAVLRQLGEQELWWREPPANGQGRSLEEAIAAEPDLLQVMDVFEQRRQRPGTAAAEARHYSGKAKGSTNKIGIIVNEAGIIRGVTKAVPGKMHDLTLMRESQLLEQLPETGAIVGDKAFDGLQHTLPNHSVGVPHKARRNQPLTEAERWANRDLSRQRIIVENSICELRHFKALAYRFRHSFNLVDAVVRAVVAIVNPRIKQRANQMALA